MQAEYRTNNPRFAILIPSWNNLSYLKLCIQSIRNYSSYAHEILVHVNEGKDGTMEWLKQQSDISISFSEQNIGVCHALNELRKMAQSPYLLYMNDDMVACPEWDRFLWEEVQRIGHNAFFLSATAIEPVPQSNCAIAGDFGRTIETFQESACMKQFQDFDKDDWNGSTWTPNLVHADYWDKVGGYSEAFSPGFYSDPDFSMKLWQQGVRLFKGVSKSRVYHFARVSTKKVTAGNPGYVTFIKKWGMSAGTFTRYYLRRGTTFTGPLPEPDLSFWIRLKNRYKRFVFSFR